MARFDKKLLFVSGLVLLCRYYTVLSTPTEAIRLQFRRMDSTLSVLILGIESAGNDIRRIETLFSDVMSNDSAFQSFLVADKKGTVVVDVNRNTNKRILGDNISEAHWFAKPFISENGAYTEITRIGNKRYFLKSRMLYNVHGIDTDSTAIFTVLIDLEYVFKKLLPVFSTPVALLVNNNLVYESDWIKDASDIYHVPGYNELFFSVARSGTQGTADVTSAGEDPVLFSWDDQSKWVIWILIFTGIFGLFAFGLSRIKLKKMKNSALIELAHSKLSPEEKERIHKMVVSHVYCEIKRRIETHEAGEMESKIRREVEEEVRQKVVAA